MIPFELRTILVFVTALLATMFILPKLANIAQRIGLVDIPHGRKNHIGPRPLVGGLGFVIAATFSSLIFIPIQGLRGYFLGLAVLLFSGFLDDFREMNPYQKFAGQIFACLLLMYFSHVALNSFGKIFGDWSFDIPDISWLIGVITVFCIVGVINAMNMIDGLDGLAGGIAFIAFLAFAGHASLAGQDSLLLLNLALAGAVLGFLRYNWLPASLFMGDAGSLCLGFSLGFMAIGLTQGGDAIVRPVVPLLILGVPIVDTVVVMLKRIIRKKSPFAADTNHFHHILLHYGWSKSASVRCILIVTSSLAGLSFLSPTLHIPDSMMFLLFTVYLLAYLAASQYMITKRRISSLLVQSLSETAASGGDRLFSLQNRARIIRRHQRYPVHLQLSCTSMAEPVEMFSGAVVDISDNGFLAILDKCTDQGMRVVARIVFPFEHYTHTIELPAQHVWSEQRSEGNCHGFQFLEFDGKQQEIVFSLLVKQKIQI